MRVNCDYKLNRQTYKTRVRTDSFTSNWRPQGGLWAGQSALFCLLPLGKLWRMVGKKMSLRVAKESPQREGVELVTDQQNGLGISVWEMWVWEGWAELNRHSPWIQGSQCSGHKAWGWFCGEPGERLKKEGEGIGTWGTRSNSVSKLSERLCLRDFLR